MKPNLQQLKDDQYIQVTLRGRPFVFATTWGLFSPEQIDDGSRMLIEALEIGPHDNILDLGCGYGVMGLSLAAETDGVIHLVDKDFIAVEYAQKNIHKNDLKNARAYLSNGFSHVPQDQKFDLIISNLPAKVSKEMYWILFNDAKKYLKNDGRFVVVVIAGLKEFIKRNFREVFGNYKKVERSQRYLVAQAIKGRIEPTAIDDGDDPESEIIVDDDE